MDGPEESSGDESDSPKDGEDEAPAWVKELLAGVQLLGERVGPPSVQVHSGRLVVQVHRGRLVVHVGEEISISGEGSAVQVVPCILLGCQVLPSIEELQRAAEEATREVTERLRVVHGKREQGKVRVQRIECSGSTQKIVQVVWKRAAELKVEKGDRGGHLGLQLCI
eukprot:TRINITY_DN27_c0_g1_i4.p3 TRINITY_DN27_c0_g1~~TRINITY_DN27_c0_g1_i4.p3  ORF type:complete len:167 (+),score=13.53 TRINITY_DN27_c0_g1_i4:419-919(+)